MSALIGVCGLLGFVVCVVLFLIALIRRKPKKKFVIGIVVCFILFVVGVSMTGDSDPETSAGEEQQQTQQNADAEDEQGQENGTKTVDTSLDTTDYIHMDADLLFEYGGYMSGEKVVTVITVSSTGSNLLKAHTDNNDSFFYSINCEFEDASIVKQYSENDVVTIAGTVGESASVGSTVKLEDCSVIGFGEIVQELKDGAEEQRQVGESFKQAQEEQAAEAEQTERETYINLCESVDYTDVARNPDNYDGLKIKISGTVEQVSEGLFNSVILRVNCDGNMWYVTYTRAEGESRILENDSITCYGECTGVTSYTSVLGAQATIPSMDMVYYS